MTISTGTITTTSPILEPSERSKALKLGLEGNLDFLLSHFEQPVIWPRKISVYMAGTGRLQVYYVKNKQEALARFKQANLLDCRVSAYPEYPYSYHHLRQQPQLPPTFAFIDLDESTFKTYRAYNMAVNKTRKNFKEILGANPTIQLTGNGVHFYQPVKLVYQKASILEDIDVFSEFADPNGRKKDLTTRLMLHIEDLCTDNKHDPNHRPSIGSCLVRVPHTLNSKCIDLQTGMYIKDPEVKILQRWDGKRATVNYILQSFRTSLINDAIKEKLRMQHLQKQQRCNNNGHRHSNDVDQYYYSYIERLLQTPIHRYRKKGVSLLIIPYLVVIKKIQSDQEIFNIASDWIDKCGRVKPLDRAHNYNYRIRTSITSSRKNQIRPMRLENLKKEDRQLYDMLVKHVG